MHLLLNFFRALFTGSWLTGAPTRAASSSFADRAFTKSCYAVVLLLVLSLLGEIQAQNNDSQPLCPNHYETDWWKSLEGNDFEYYQRLQRSYMQRIRQQYEDNQIFNCICDFHVAYYDSATSHNQSTQQRNAFFFGDQALLRRADTCIEAEFSLTVDRNTIPEDGGRATVTVSTGGAIFFTDQTITLSLAGTATRGTDYNVSKMELTLHARQTSAIARVTAVNDTEDDDGETIVIAAHHAGETVGETRTLTIIDDDEPLVVTLVLTPDVIGENDEVSTVTATLDRASSETTTVTVTTSPGAGAESGDFTQSDSRLTIPAGETASTGVVTITAVDNGVDAPDKSVTVTGTARNDVGVEQPDARTLTIMDDEGTPGVTLVLTPDVIGENDEVSTVTATLDRASSETTTVTVTTSPGAGAESGDFTQSDSRLTIPAGETASTGVVTITAVDNGVDAPDKSVTVTGTARNDVGVEQPDARTLTIMDDEGTPGVTLVLTPDVIGENDEVSTVTATLDRASSETTTVTVTTSPGAGAESGDFTQSDSRLTIPAGETASTGVVTITAVDNGVDAPDKSVTVTGTARNDVGVEQPDARTLTIMDDEGTPGVTLVLTPDVIGENDEVSTVTATLDRASSETTTVTVTTSPGAGAESGDFTQSDSRLTIPAGETASTGVVTITAVDNGVDAPDKSVTVTGTARNDVGVEQPDARTLTIMDDEGTPGVTLVLTPDVIGENDEVSTVTATLDRASSETTTVTVTTSPGAGAESGDFTQSDSRLTIPAGETASTGVVTITAVDNGVDAPDKSVTVTGTARNDVGVEQPDARTLTIMDDEGTPGVTLVLTPDVIGENDEVSTVTATLDRASSETTTVTVTTSPGAGAESGDFTQSDSRLTIPAGETASTGVVTITAVDNGVDAPDKSVTVTGTARNDVGVEQPDARTLTIMDDEGTPGVTLVLTPDVIGENDEVSTVTATLDRASSETTTVTVTTSPGAGAESGDFTQSDSRLTIPAGETASTGVVTITAVDNGVDAPDKSVTVTGTARNDVGVEQPDARTLTIMDDEGTPGVTLVLTPDVIGENDEVSTVTATLDRASSETTTVTVTTSPGAGAESGDFTQSDSRLTIPAGETASTGVVTITAVDNGVDAPDKSVTVTGTARNDVGVEQPDARTLTIMDDEGTPGVTLVLTPDVIGENDEVSTVTATLDRASSETTTVTVTTSPGAGAESGDFTQSDSRLTIPAGETASTGVVTITAVDNGVDAPDKSVTVTGTARNDVGVEQPDARTLTIMDDDIASVEVTETTLTLPEGGNGRYELSLTSEPEGEVTVTVVSDDPGAVTALPERLTFDSGNWDDPQSVTVRAEDDAIPDDGKTVVLRHEVAGYGRVTVAHVTVSVMSDISDAKEVVEETLEAVVTSTLSNVTTNIGTRFSAARGGTAVTVAGQPIPIAESALALAAFHDHSDSALYNGHDSERRGRDLNLSRLLETSAFQVSLLAAEENTQGAGPAQSLTVWGRVDRMFFDKESGDINRYGGDLKAGYLGIDTWLDDRWLIGVAASVTMVEADYGLSGAGGKLGLSMLGVHPYLRLALDDLSELWVILGVSKGEITNSETGSAPEESNIIMYMGAAGMRRELTTIGGIDIALLGDAGFGSLRSGGRSDLQVVDNLSADTWRARLGLSGSHTILLADQATFTPFVEVMGRYDAGDDNVGVEIAGGIQYANPASGLGLEMRANILPLYSESDYREYGFSLSASASPGAGGEGLAMAISTSLGPETGNVAGLSSKDLFASAHPAVNLSEMLSINGEVGYGFPVVGARGVLTPFGQFRVRNDGGRQMHAGVRLGRMTSATPWNLELSGGQRTSEASDPEYLVSLLGRVRF